MLRSGRAVAVALWSACSISCSSDPGASTPAADAASSSGGAPASGGVTSGGGSSGGGATTTGSGGVMGSGGFDGADGSTGPDLGAADAACRTGAAQSECISCCDGHHPNAFMVQAEQTRACACVSPGICANICSTTYCAKQPDNMGSCYDCVFSMLAVGEPCFQVARDACGADSACTEYVDCRANCVR